MTKLSSEELQRLIAGYVLYNLTSEESAILEQLLSTDPAIAQEVERTQKALELAYAAPEVSPPKGLRASILTAHQAIPQSVPRLDAKADTQPFSLSTSSSPRQRGWVTGLRAAAALLIVGLSISNYALWRSLQATRAQMQAANVLTVSLEPAAEGVSASVKIVINPSSLDATLKVQDLPPLPEGQVYVLWTVLQPDAPFTTDDKNAILTEVFTLNPSEELEQFPLPPVYRERRWVEAIAITIESASAPQRHESSPILLERL